MYAAGESGAASAGELWRSGGDSGRAWLRMGRAGADDSMVARAGEAAAAVGEHSCGEVASAGESCAASTGELWRSGGGGVRARLRMGRAGADDSVPLSLVIVDDSTPLGLVVVDDSAPLAENTSPAANHDREASPAPRERRMHNHLQLASRRFAACVIPSPCRLHLHLAGILRNPPPPPLPRPGPSSHQVGRCRVAASFPRMPTARPHRLLPAPPYSTTPPRRPPPSLCRLPSHGRAPRRTSLCHARARAHEEEKGIGECEKREKRY
nr:uncharacterized protein LOC112939890 [Oryza sativa Japonica Group]XP_025883331.1 uncharacterized protein LOC112939890 [Oryza sativa Japonica Group]XP_025883332.1 uncharacterized protein LOC112939890 [Oryza sativa Japonica Group]XP_025883333.1 uncharacterized protein LOC112939890 [Oryza sativa Japonica Group]XP_025883334.1 uncharacterized protein LOC112939890 [Oryza sativa Japonica Group]